MKHTKLPFVNGWGVGLTGPTTPAYDVFCGGRKWPYEVISKERETIAVIPQQEDGTANAAFIVKACNNHYQLLKLLTTAYDLVEESISDTKQYDYEARAKSLVNQALEAIKQAEDYT